MSWLIIPGILRETRSITSYGYASYINSWQSLMILKIIKETYKYQTHICATSSAGQKFGHLCRQKVYFFILLFLPIPAKSCSKLHVNKQFIYTNITFFCFHCEIILSKNDFLYDFLSWRGQPSIALGNVKCYKKELM